MTKMTGQGGRLLRSRGPLAPGRPLAIYSSLLGLITEIKADSITLYCMRIIPLREQGWADSVHPPPKQIFVEPCQNPAIMVYPTSQKLISTPF